MMYLSKGVLIKSCGNDPKYISHCGRIYALGPEMAKFWEKGRFVPQTVPIEKERMICRMETSGLVSVTDEEGALAFYRLLSGCIICPDTKRWTDRFLPVPARRIWKWLNEAGLRLTASELVRLEERQIQPTPALLGKEGRQRLTEMIYFADTIPDGILETMMEYSPARDATVTTLLRLLRSRHLLLI